MKRSHANRLISIRAAGTSIYHGWTQMATDSQAKRSGAEVAKSRRGIFLCASPRSLRLGVFPQPCPAVSIRGLTASLRLRPSKWRVLACALLIAGGTVASSHAAESSMVPGAELFASGSIPRIKIELKPEAVASLHKNAREFVSATVSEGTAVYSQVALHLKGATGSFRPLDDKPALTLDFSRFQAGQKFHGLRRIHLNNSVEDPSYTNEKLGSELFAAAGVPAPRVTRALVELNGRALGLYVLKEGFTEDFLALHFQRVSGELYEPGEGHDVNEALARNSVAAPFDHERSALKQLAAAALETNSSQGWGKLETSLDAKKFLTFMAMEIMLGHRDGYCLARNNFRVYHDLDSGKMVFFPHGMDQLFGISNLPWQPHLAGVVARAVMATPEGKQNYAATFSSLFTNVFKVEALTNRVDQLVLELRPALSRREWNEVGAAAGLVKEQILKRQLSLLAQLQRPVPQPIVFLAGAARLTDWEIADRPTSGKIDEVEVDGRPALHITTRAASASFWHTTVMIPRGHYRFEGRVRIAGVERLPFGEHQGAGLRIGGQVRETGSLIGDAPWQMRAAAFEIAPPAQAVELICELRARAGEAWFDLNSLCVRQIDTL